MNVLVHQKEIFLEIHFYSYGARIYYLRLEKFSTAYDMIYANGLLKHIIDYKFIGTH